MTKQLKLTFTYCLIAFGLFFTSCTDDGLDPNPVVLDPLISLDNSPPSLVNGGDTLKFTVRASIGDNQLNGLTVYENSAQIPTGDLRII